MFALFKTAFLLLIIMTLLTGIAYPLAVTAFAQVAFHREANGSLFESPKTLADPQQRNPHNGQVNPSPVDSWIGSTWIGQPFSDPKYFWGRPSSTAPQPYNGMGGSGSNLATTNPALHDAVAERVKKLKEADPENKELIPIDLVTASSSGLDPHISEAAAVYQYERVARVRQLDPQQVRKLIVNHTERPTIGILGQTRVNVLKLNLALDELASKPEKE